MKSPKLMKKSREFKEKSVAIIGHMGSGKTLIGKFSNFKTNGELILIEDAKTNLDISNQLGDLDLKNITGSIRANTNNGNISINKYYGNLLIIWDKLFGTYAAEQEEVRYGIRENVNTFNPLKITFMFWYSMYIDFEKSKGIKSKLLSFFGTPEWKPKS